MGIWFVVIRVCICEGTWTFLPQVLIRFFHCRFSDRSGGSGLEQRWPRALAGCVFPWDGEIKETVYLDDVGRCAHLHKPQYNRWLSLIITLTKKRRAPAHSNAAEASCVHANIGLQYSISHLEKDWVNFKPLLFFFGAPNGFRPARVPWSSQTCWVIWFSNLYICVWFEFVGQLQAQCIFEKTF